MRYYQHEGTQPATALEAVRESYTGTDLTQLYRACIGGKPPSRKEDLATALLQLIEGDRLGETLAKLKDREQKVVAETAWSKMGMFDRDRFNAKYGRASSGAGRPGDADDAEEEKPASSGVFSAREQKKSWSILDVIQPCGVMPRDLQQRIRQLVPKPAPAAIHPVESVPDHVDLPVHRWNAKTAKHERSIEAVSLIHRDMERAALADLLAVLRVVDAGKVGVTEKNHWPTPAAIRQIGEVIQAGDFYADEETNDKKKTSDDDLERPGPIRAFAWPMLIQAGKLAKVQGSRLALTPAGRNALTAPVHETIRELWQQWLQSDLLDELRRINVIRGQTGKGQRHLTNPAERREAIVAALEKCPIASWVAIDAFSRYMRADGHEFEVTTDPWTLFIFEQQYGSLGYQGYHDWKILQLRYVLCVLMEYAATLGLIDIAFIHPEGARPDYGDMWGTDDLAFFSRYDGLLYMRLTGLGAYALVSLLPSRARN